MPKPVYPKAKLLDELFAREDKLRLASLDKGKAATWKGNANASFAVVCTYYSEQSDEQRLMVGCLHHLGIDASHVYLTTAMKHFLLRTVEDQAVIESRSVTVKEIDNLRPFLLEELAIVKPKVVICLGTNSAKVLFGDNQLSIRKMRGIPQYPPGANVEAWVTWSPSYILRTGKAMSIYNEFSTDLLNAFNSSKVEDES